MKKWSKILKKQIRKSSTKIYNLDHKTTFAKYTGIGITFVSSIIAFKTTPFNNDLKCIITSNDNENENDNESIINRPLFCCLKGLKDSKDSKDAKEYRGCDALNLFYNWFSYTSLLLYPLNIYIPLPIIINYAAFATFLSPEQDLEIIKRSLPFRNVKKTNAQFNRDMTAIIISETNVEINVIITHTNGGISFKALYVKLQHLDKSKKLNIHLKTSGGTYRDCLLACKEIKKWIAPTTTHVDHHAHSCGTILALTTDNLFMNEMATLSAINPITPCFDKTSKVNFMTRLLLGNPETNENKQGVREVLNKKYNIENIIYHMYDNVADHSTVFSFQECNDIINFS